MKARRSSRRHLSSITESWDTPADQQQWQLAQQRYGLAAKLAEGRIIAEIGCGTGFGLAKVAPWASRAVGLDLDQENLAIARRRAPECSFVRADAMALPLDEASVDVLVGLEMVYYVADQPAFFAEAARVLRPGGQLMLTMPNPTREFFQRSPFSTHYPDYDELIELSLAAGFESRVYGSHRFGTRAFKERLRRILVGSGLMPRTIRGRARLKSVANRRMRRLGDLTIEPATAQDNLTALSCAQDADGFAVWVVLATTAQSA